jgi:hypothetical protein
MPATDFHHHHFTIHGAKIKLAVRGPYINSAALEFGTISDVNLSPIAIFLPCEQIAALMKAAEAFNAVMAQHYAPVTTSTLEEDAT